MCSMNEQPLKEDIFNILRVLSTGDDHSQRGLSDHLGFSLGKTNYLLRELVKKGFIKIGRFTSTGQKLKKAKYILTKKGFKEQVQLTYYYLKIKEKEYLDLKKEMEKVSNSVEDNEKDES